MGQDRHYRHSHLSKLPTATIFFLLLCFVVVVVVVVIAVLCIKLKLTKHFFFLIKNIRKLE